MDNWYLIGISISMLSVLYLFIFEGWSGGAKVLGQFLRDFLPTLG